MKKLLTLIAIVEAATGLGLLAAPAVLAVATRRNTRYTSRTDGRARRWHGAPPYYQRRLLVEPGEWPRVNRSDAALPCCRCGRLHSGSARACAYGSRSMAGRCSSSHVSVLVHGVPAEQAKPRLFELIKPATQ
jgi:hypothetical protein